MSTETEARRIDAALARHLFGLSVRNEDGLWAEDGTRYGSLVEFYSTTGDGMLLVLEAMRARGWSATLHLSCHSEDDASVQFDRGSEFFVVSATTLPMAVALAALKALGVEVPS